MANPGHHPDWKKTSIDEANRALTSANLKGAACLSEGTEFSLTGAWCVEEGYIDRITGKRVHTDRSYAFFEGQKNGHEVPYGINAGLFMRRPFEGFPEETQLTEFQKALNDCLNASDLYTLLDAEGVFDGKKIIVTKVVRVTEIPYGGKEERPVPYAIFDTK